MSQLCFQNLRYDVRLIDQLRSYELRHFLILLDFAADLRDPTFIPAKKREALRLTLRFGNGDNGKAALAARLRRFEALDLIEVNPDCSISITYLIDQEIDDGEDFPSSPAPIPGRPIAPTGGERRTVPDLRSGFDRRQPGRTYSTDPAAVRQRERRKQLAEAEGLAPKTSSPEVVTFGENVTENVTTFESKRHATEPESTPQNVTNERDISALPLAGVSPNVNVSNEEDYKIISDSGDVSNVAAKTSQPEMSQNVTASDSRNVTPPAAPNVTGQNAPPGPRVPVRPGFEEVDQRAQMMRDVEKISSLARDAKSRGFYIKVWKHCFAHNSLSCWDMAAEILTEKITTEARLGPPPGQPGHFPPSAYGKSLNTTLMNLLRDNGTPFEQGSAAEREDVQRQVRESLGSVITPLEDIMPEMEESE